MRDLRLAMVDLAPTFQDLQPAATDGRIAVPRAARASSTPPTR